MIDAFDIRGNPGAFGSATDRLSGSLFAEKWRYGEVEVAEIQARVIPYIKLALILHSLHS